MTYVAWHQPPEGMLKLNIDGSFDQNSKMGGTSGVIRDHLGSWIAGFSCKVKVVNAHHAELLALLHGLNLAQKININHLLVETDSQVLLNTLESSKPIHSHIYSNYRSMLILMGGSIMNHIMREDVMTGFGRYRKANGENFGSKNFFVVTWNFPT
ncbi:hypothetical protein R3W88_033132 [Solanum pinnatisectum]|uniref:RNase H type-1 domain-containing protein n=1 Tax=Solanum pinnatisectum TaxID=50273 RepID=A0AAV9K407_9SOLN|nr:hypothetical protein R3W88_033132 [Solanum pinnatisectum]